MFKRAFNVAKLYTRPIIATWKTLAGECSMWIGTFVIVNRDGYALTAYHIVRDGLGLLTEASANKTVLANRSAIDGDPTISRNEKKRRLAQLPKVNYKAPIEASLWWGQDQVQIASWAGVEAVDIALVKLAPFDPTSVQTYPAIKDPGRDYDLGVSLARLGYPFQQVKPVWNDTTKAFELPLAGGLPVFMNDGILSRMISFHPAPGSPQHPFPLSWIETSNPGLKGQSGGPIFDAEGTVWAIQSNTASYPLDFEPAVPNRPGQKEYQFLNVGRGVHAETIVALLRQQNVNFALSNY